jgi:hypothetical protein
MAKRSRSEAVKPARASTISSSIAGQFARSGRSRWKCEVLSTSSGFDASFGRGLSLSLMADTRELKLLAEPAVRAWLSAEYDLPVETDEVAIQLPGGGFHRFDVVSEDRSLVAGAKSSRIRARGGVGAGVIKSIYTEILFLHLVVAETKLLVLTDPDLFTYFERISRGKLPLDVQLLHFPLPDSIAIRLGTVHEAASLEIGKRTVSVDLEAARENYPRDRSRRNL